MGTKKDSTIYDVAIYCRLSKEDLKEDGDRDESASIGTQKAILTDYVRQRGWHLVQTYVDDGYSGTNFQRPGFLSAPVIKCKKTPRKKCSFVAKEVKKR